jgi:hypothetical protein
MHMPKPKLPAPPHAAIDWLLFRHHVTQRWPESMEAVRAAGGDINPIGKFWGDHERTLPALSMLCLCRAMGVDPRDYLIGGAKLERETA